MPRILVSITQLFQNFMTFFFHDSQQSLYGTFIGYLEVHLGQIKDLIDGQVGRTGQVSAKICHLDKNGLMGNAIQSQPAPKISPLSETNSQKDFNDATAQSDPPMTLMKDLPLAEYWLENYLSYN